MFEAPNMIQYKKKGMGFMMDITQAVSPCHRMFRTKQQNGTEGVWMLYENQRSEAVHY